MRLITGACIFAASIFIFMIVAGLPYPPSLRIYVGLWFVYCAGAATADMERK